jgi:peptide deformylase
MESQIDAVAIAAVQIGVPVRLFIISHRAFEIEEKIKDKRKMIPRLIWYSLIQR